MAYKEAHLVKRNSIPTATPKVVSAICVTDLTTKESTTFPMMPERIVEKAAQSFLSYRIMDMGEVKIPSGEELTSFSWNGILPGEARKNAPYVSQWTAPQKMQEKFSLWRSTGHRLRLTITGTSINHVVLLQDYTCEASGGMGDISYQVSFVLSKQIVIDVSSGNQKEKQAATAKPSSTPPKKTHTVVAGDSLWAIAQKYMGNGSSYPQLYAANQGVIDPKNKQSGNSKYTIYPGQVLTIPSS